MDDGVSGLADSRTRGDGGMKRLRPYLGYIFGGVTAGFLIAVLGLTLAVVHIASEIEDSLFAALGLTTFLCFFGALLSGIVTAYTWMNPTERKVYAHRAVRSVSETERVQGLTTGPWPTTAVDAHLARRRKETDK